MSNTVNNINIKFSDLRTKRGNESFTGGNVLGTNNISLSEFRGTKFKDGSVVPENNSISINTHFKGKTFSREYTTDGFRAYSNWSSYPSKLTGTGSSSDSFWSGSNTSNINVKLLTSNSSEPYSSLILVPGEQSGTNTDKFMIVDRSDPNAIDDAEVWFKVKSHASYNQVQFGLLKKDHDITWKQQIDHSQLQNHHASKADRLAFHGAGFHPYSGSRDDIISSDNVVSPSWTDYTSSLNTYSDITSQGLTTKFHNVIGLTAGTRKSSTNAGNLESEFNRKKHFFTNWPSFSGVYNYPGYRSNSLNPSHGLKIKWYEKTINVYLTKDSQYIIPQNGGSWTNDSDSSTGLTGIFSGMYVLSVSPNSGIPVQDTEDSGSQYNVFIGKIHTNYMVMYQERGTSDLTTINATASGNVTLTLGGYLYWTLTTMSDTISSNTNYQNPKIIGPPHTVLPRWQVDSEPTSNTISGFYQTKEWGFYIGDTTNSGSNYFEYVLRNEGPSGTPFNYSVSYSSGTIPSNNPSYEYAFNNYSTLADPLSGSLSGVTPSLSGINIRDPPGWTNISWYNYSMGHRYKFLVSGQIIAIGSMNRYGSELKLFRDGNSTAVASASAWSSWSYDATNRYRYVTLSSSVSVSANQSYWVMIKNYSGGYSGHPYTVTPYPSPPKTTTSGNIQFTASGYRYTGRGTNSSSSQSSLTQYPSVVRSSTNYLYGNTDLIFLPD